MSALATRCPECNTALKIGQPIVGVNKCSCPKCNTQFEVTLTADEATSAPARDTRISKAPKDTALRSGPIDEQHVLEPAPRPPLERPKATGSSTGMIAMGCGVLVVLGLLLTCLAGGLGVGGVGFWRMGARDKGPDIVGGGNPNPNNKDNDKKPEEEKKNDPEAPPNENGNPKGNGGDPPKLNRLRLSDQEWTARSRIIPFDAVAPRSRLEEIEAVKITGTATFTFTKNLNEITITWESLRRMKFEERNPANVETILLLIRDHGWSVKNGNILTLGGDGLAFYQNFNYGTILSNLIPLTEAGFDVVAGADKDIRGVACSSAVVKRPGRAPLTLYFDKKTKLLHKADFTGRFLDANNRFDPRTTFVEFYFRDYAVFDGVKHWRIQEQWRDGQKYAETKLTDIKFLRKADDSLFATRGLEAQIRTAMAKYESTEKQEKLQSALAKVGGQGTAFTRLVRALEHNDASLRELAQTTLLLYAELFRRQMTPPFERGDVDALMTVLKRVNQAEMQALALEGVTRLGPVAIDAAPALIALARDSRDNRQLAALLIALRGTGARTDETLKLFEAHIDHNDPAVKDTATLAILQLAPERLQLNRVVDLMARPNQEVRRAADQLLRERLTRVTAKDLAQLRAQLKNPTKEVRIAFIDAIGSLNQDGVAALPDLTLLIGAAEKDVSQHAVAAVEKLGKLVEVAQTQTNPGLLLPTLTALRGSRTQTPEAFTAYEKHLDHTDAGVKEASALALLDLGPQRLQTERLMTLMASPNNDIRGGAEKFLRERLTGVTAKDLPMLRQGLKDPTRQVRVLFLDAIGALKADGQPAGGDVAAVLDNADAAMALQTIRILEDMGKPGPAALRSIADQIDSREKSIRVAATHALCKLDPAHDALKTRGLDVLLEDATPDIMQVDALLKRPLGSRSVGALLDMGEPAVAPMLAQFLTKNDPKKVGPAQQWSACAGRYLAYQMLNELAARAKKNGDKKLIATLRKQELRLKVAWEQHETPLEKQAKMSVGLTPEARQLITATEKACYQAYKTVGSLK